MEILYCSGDKFKESGYDPFLSIKVLNTIPELS